ncbi:hypothetical protein [Alloactinosynnema sp. L-07]|nr:hypothetical protein [Alloactinosynnema sp. L-07]
MACEELARTPSARAVGHAEITAWVDMVGEMAVGWTARIPPSCKCSTRP